MNKASDFAENVPVAKEQMNERTNTIEYKTDALSITKLLHDTKAKRQ